MSTLATMVYRQTGTTPDIIEPYTRNSYVTPGGGEAAQS